MGSKKFERYFFVDYENVNFKGLDGIDELTARDYVRLYYSHAADTLPIEAHLVMLSSPAKFEFVKVEMPIKNFMDCMILMDVKEMTSKKKKPEYLIVSRDRDFDKSIDQLCESEFRVKRVSNLRADDVPPPPIRMLQKKSVSETAPKKGSSMRAAKKLTAKSAIQSKPDQTEQAAPDTPAAVSESAEKPTAAPEKTETPNVESKSAAETAAAETKPAAQPSAEKAAPIIHEQIDALKQKEAEVRAFIDEHFRDITISTDREENIEKTVQAVLNGKTKTQINTSLMKIYDSDSIKLIYNELKPLMKDLPGK